LSLLNIQPQQQQQQQQQQLTNVPAILPKNQICTNTRHHW
jgi:hypothetical protein